MIGVVPANRPGDCPRKRRGVSGVAYAAEVTAQALSADELVDRFGRVHSDLRVSVTDRCNLRCTYCMPAEGLPWLPSKHLLGVEEIARVVGVAVALGIRSVRLTGGEPLLRPDLVDIVRRLAALTPRPELSLTTNGMRLAALAEPLAEAGLDRVNVSLDTLRPATFRTLARRDGLHEVIGGMQAAHDAGLRPVKVNTVLMRGINDDEAVSLVEFCLAHGYECRFIEQMPLDPQHSWDRNAMVNADEILESLSTRWTLTPVPRTDSAPAEVYLIDGGPARVGVIASVSQPFCGSCNRLRLTADGQVRNCLFARAESDVRLLVRGGADDNAIADVFRMAVGEKRFAHGIDDPDFVQPDRPMSAIGG